MLSIHETKSWYLYLHTICIWCRSNFQLFSGSSAELHIDRDSYQMFIIKSSSCCEQFFLRRFSKLTIKLIETWMNALSLIDFLTPKVETNLENEKKAKA